MKSDVIIIGAGPAGIFASLELVQKSNLSVLMVDKGLDIDTRQCPARLGVGCISCRPTCSLLSGWGDLEHLVMAN